QGGAPAGPGRNGSRSSGSSVRRPVRPVPPSRPPAVPHGAGRRSGGTGGRTGPALLLLRNVGPYRGGTSDGHLDLDRAGRGRAGRGRAGRAGREPQEEGARGRRAAGEP